MVGDGHTVRTVADVLLDVLPPIEAMLPPGTMGVAGRTQRQNFIRTERFDADVAISPNDTVLLLHDSPGPLRAGSGHRVLPIRPVADVDAALESLSAARPFLQCLGVAGFDDLRVFEDLTLAGLNRVCPLGMMQRPPLTWLHDGIGTIRPLMRWLTLA